ncbi:hypothetical protein CB0940_09327 [Cercospora beticola]|uniref:GYF domain-containing protein n=1 Tax=Cercospora beticola TaxID=122368 RepID=A0A2G5HI04_CERBT|nr:hypothetical protein CB0940_09327 [Cercospora beticola]PIA92159.1 hypothetical protein CB0940_09327 [Cercospora beticola]WPB06358.1 hypothetical protein RHO25_011015 [Cercospora beticola]
MSDATSAARPKREAEDFARSHDTNNNGTTKKPRFDYRNPSTLAADAPSEDLILDADVIGKSGTNTKRNAVNIDGYESDSDNDNFDARAREKARRQKAEEKQQQNKSKDEEDDDMFADLEEDLNADGDEDEEVQREGKGKGKDVRFLEQSEIEGQVMNSEGGGHVSADILMRGKGKGRQDEESESSGDEEERDQLPDEMDDEDARELGAGSKKKHAPRLDAYNLKNEEEEGRFDESGNFIRKAADPDAVNDNWLEGLSKKDMKKAKEAEEKREEERRRKAMEDDAVLTSDVLSKLIAQLETGETPLEALQRLGKGKTDKKVPKWKQKKQQKKNDGMDVDEPEANGNGTVDPKEDARRKAVEAITGAADALYSRGQHEIYQAEREILMRQYRRETGEDWKAAAPAEGATGAGAGAGSEGSLDAWEYRWSDARDGGSSHGPYDAATMRAWNEAGYFGEGVEFRRVGDSAEWSKILDSS